MKNRLLSTGPVLMILVIFMLFGNTPLFSISQQDIDTVIRFADSIINIAEKNGIKTTGISIEEFYSEVIEKAFPDLQDLFDKNNWTFEQIEEILYPIGLIMSFINEIKEDYILEILAEEGITKEDIEIVLKNAARLSGYFVSLNLGDLTGDLDLDDLDNLDNLDDYDNPDTLDNPDYPDDIDLGIDMDDTDEESDGGPPPPPR